ncbi:hypothetical protein SS50377_27910 [Spironucleus salmonicida]|uniref:Uncharacterized protein n=1 Tax=Spironucleus salmonicida TaxID=348837 RepID=V6LP12_9EUKA|nr:hypothetical protein SS50377_27910 [Spironucleus salmonicida]|eukprot:EST42469.1 Hypothetical protein SS50377_17775 [Spironucleus salmonicida]
MIPLQTLQAILPATPHLITAHQYKNQFAAACLNMIYIFDDFQFKFTIAVPSKPTQLLFSENLLYIATESGFYGEFSVQTQLFVSKKDFSQKITALTNKHIFLGNVLVFEDEHMPLSTSINFAVEFNNNYLLFDIQGNMFELRENKLSLLAEFRPIIQVTANSQFLAILTDQNHVLLINDQFQVVKELTKQGVVIRSISLNQINDILYAAENEIFGIME